MPDPMRTPWLILEIAVLKRGPQALPCSFPLTATALLAYGASGILAQRAIAPSLPAVPPVLFDLALSVALVSFLLWARGRLQRFAQTVSALAGTGTILTLCGLPVIRFLQSGGEGSAVSMLGVILWLGLIVWSLAVTAHILRHAIEVSFGVGLVLATGFLVVSVVLYGAIFGTGQ